MDNIVTIAKKLGLIETINLKLTTDSESNEHTTGIAQSFDYVVVIDFESTCWDSKNQNQSWQCLPEIIEFPAVLINLATGIVEDEFHSYVMPVENPKLSKFCTKLTGITQNKVDCGVPLATCLMLFGRWISNISFQKNISFHNNVPCQKSCTFVTWSDWDLAVCLNNEVKRKQIRSPEILTQWIDLRAIYRIFYSRKPQGLRGALAELGIPFQGREHSGIADARNTALLAHRMVVDGCQLKVTSSLQLPSAQKKAWKYQEQKQRKLEVKRTLSQKSMHGGQPLQLKQNPSLITPKRMLRAPGISKELIYVVTPEQNSTSLSTPNRRIQTPSSCKRTPPLCRCGKRAIFKVANSPGPNQGRSFYSCSSNRRSLGVSKKRSGCGFFVWC